MTPEPSRATLTVDVLAVSQEDWGDDEYREWARDRLAEHAGHVPHASRERVVQRLR